MEIHLSQQGEYLEGADEPETERLAEAIELLKWVLRTHHPLDDPIWGQLDLTLNQFKGLRVIAHGPVTIGEFAARLGIAQPTASLLVERLVRVGLVERADDPRNRRRALARLSPEGERFVARITGDIHSHLHEGLARLSDDDLAALIRGLHALMAATKEETDRSTQA
jgi:DNA-binding MarR family transcriptional regulator